ncbi:2Fe-2S iron-sulfur cluster-binding protein [Novosphingobium sp.]|uniref:2Fe-2S iron-sulfur cluster-binding protein n=1 Tax=Novosphingobium sp. TaxID=1874826 RepID=UPI0027347EC1|nr:2Fe-2S iron-sulfur cluster-binding protein [Novosphingobium sp.]MDP3905907.1 2Fe-2S iron-sulfur cluster-binding protein [Novosphingobium sp.]
MNSIKVQFVDPKGELAVINDAEVGHTLMEVAKAHGVEGIMGDCGGACACATCHVYVDEAWRAKVGEADEIESEMLDLVSDIVRPGSRLSCQIKVTEELDGLIVTVAPAA